YRLNENTEIMAEHFTQNFVNLRGLRLGPDGGSELRLNHRERGFNVRPFVVLGEKFLPVELVKVEHPTPEFRPDFPVGVALEGDVWGGSNVRDRPDENQPTAERSDRRVTCPSECHRSRQRRRHPASDTSSMDEK